MKWTIEYQDAYERLIDRSDFEEGGETRNAILLQMGAWTTSGPPAEIDGDPVIDAWSCEVFGTPVTVEYKVWPEIQTVFVIDFHDAS